MRALQNIVSAVVGAVVVLLLIELLPSTNGEPVRSPSPEPSTRTLVVNERTGVDLEALRREVRATIRDELSAAHAATQTIDEDAETPLPSAAQISNADWAKTVIATAVATGRWTSDDRERLRSMIDGLHPADRDEVLQEWAAAVNEQRLRPETPPI